MCPAHRILVEINGNKDISFDLTNTVSVAALILAATNIQLLDRKQSDYGPRNIADFGLHGVIIRANDKLQRARNLVFNTTTPNNESLADTMADLSNYGLIGQLLLANKWPL